MIESLERLADILWPLLFLLGAVGLSVWLNLRSDRPRHLPPAE